MTASEYAGEQEDTSDEVDELESQRDEIDESSDGDDVQVSVPSKVIDMQLILVLIVQVAKIAKDKGKSVSSRGRDKKKKRKNALHPEEALSPPPRSIIGTKSLASITPTRVKKNPPSVTMTPWTIQASGFLE